MIKKRILLTGGSGFVGRNIVEQRKSRYSILYPNHKDLDLTNTKKVESFLKNKGPFDVIIHAANIGGKRSDFNRTGIVQTNLRMFINLVRNKRYYKKFIHLGTGAEYDKSADLKKIRETEFDKNIPADKHSFSKYLISKYIENLDNVYCLRIFGIYGKYEDYTLRFISNLICKYIIKKPLTMIQNAHFEFLYMDDFINLLDYFISNKPGYRFYNLGTGNRHELLSIARIINQLDNYRLPIKIQKKGFNKEYTCDNRRLLKEVPDFRFRKIDEAIKQMYNWYRKNWRQVDTRAIITDQFNR